MKTARAALAAAGSVLALAVTVPPSAAVVGSDFAEWASAPGAPAELQVTVQLPGLGGPVATVTSDAIGVLRLSGADLWFGPDTPPGRVFGSSRDRRHAGLRTAADDADSPSTTTYTFAQPPAAGWGFVLGDLDAESAGSRTTVRAVRADGEPATVTEMGFEGVFHSCNVTPRPSGCTTDPSPGGVPTWDPDTAALTDTGPETTGASVWFRPTVPLRSLSVELAPQDGRSTYQTWIAGQTRSVSGAVSDGAGACDPTTATVSLRDGAEVLARATPAADGSYRFTAVAARPGLDVSLAGRPDGCVLADGQAPVLAVEPTALDDESLDFAVREQPEARGTLTGALADSDPEEERVVKDVDGRVAGARLTVASTPRPRAEPRPEPRPHAGPIVVLPSPDSPPLLTVAESTPAAASGSSPMVTVLPEAGGPGGSLVPLGVALLVGGATTVAAARRHRQPASAT